MLTGLGIEISTMQHYVCKATAERLKVPMSRASSRRVRLGLTCKSLLAGHGTGNL